MNRYIIVYEHSYERATTLASYVVTADSEEDAIVKVRNGEGEQTQEEFVSGEAQAGEIKDVTNIGIG
tara:strand:- start:92 stop:292 length:201 start_codon:yes stop_codon:yes gene_type:complete